MADNRKVNAKSFVWGALAGGTAGALTALLLASKSGKELRADVKAQARQIGDKTKQLAEGVSEKTQAVVRAIGGRDSASSETVKDAGGAVAGEIRGWKERKQEAETAEAAEAGGAANDSKAV